MEHKIRYQENLSDPEFSDTSRNSDTSDTSDDSNDSNVSNIRNSSNSENASKTTEDLKTSSVRCLLCPWKCELAPGERSFCGVRMNQDGMMRDVNYGLLSAACLDPIEKKPLYRFHPGSRILSIGSNGCNLRCRHCQNFSFVMAAEFEIEMMDTTPEEVVETALSYRDAGNIGIAYTYNEPVTMYDFVMDTAVLAKKAGLVNVLVSNGYILREPLEEMLPYFDAMNIDLKCFSEEGYRYLGGNLTTVLETIKCVRSYGIHVEIAYLVIPEWNDGDDEMRKAAGWIASVDREIPLHINRFFPRYKVLDKPPTPIDTLERLAGIAREYLKDVFIGNV